VRIKNKINVHNGNFGSFKRWEEKSTIIPLFRKNSFFGFSMFPKVYFILLIASVPP